MNTTVARARIEAELCVYHGDLDEALLTIEEALVGAPAELRPDLEEARRWIEELMPARPSWVGDA